jgi:DNA replication licensing factor MCM3
MANEEQDQRLRQSQRAYVSFLDDGEQDGHYEGLVKEMIANKEKRLIVNINDLRRAAPERAKSLIENAGDEIVALQVSV